VSYGLMTRGPQVLEAARKSADPTPWNIMNRAHDMRSAGTRRDQKASKEQSVAYDDRAHDMRSAGTTATGCDASLIRSKARSILRASLPGDPGGLPASMLLRPSWLPYDPAECLPLTGVCPAMGALAAPPPEA